MDTNKKLEIPFSKTWRWRASNGTPVRLLEYRPPGPQATLLNSPPSRSPIGMNSASIRTRPGVKKGVSEASWAEIGLLKVFRRRIVHNAIT